MIKSFSELLNEAKRAQRQTVGVVAAEDEHSILTVKKCRELELANFILFGRKDNLLQLLKKYSCPLNGIEIENCNDVEESAEKAVKMANQGVIKVILKGNLPTAALMKPILDKENGLRQGGLLSDVLVVENPAKNYQGLLGMSDGGLNILPTIDQKKEIILNAVAVFHKLGYKKPKVGILAAIETVKESMPATVDAARLTEMNRNGELGECLVYGPLALDIAVSPEAARHKGVENEVAGMAEILIVPNIEAGNILGKVFTYYLNIPVAHTVMGAKIPILIPSRNETEKDKIYSVALGVIVGS